MRYLIGRDSTGRLLPVKLWKGESVQAAAALNQCTIDDPNMLFECKQAVMAAIRQMRTREASPGYDPSADHTVADIGRLHLGGGRLIRVRVKDTTGVRQVLVQRLRNLGADYSPAGSIGRLAPSAARRLAQLLLQAADLIEKLDAEGKEARHGS